MVVQFRVEFAVEDEYEDQYEAFTYDMRLRLAGSTTDGIPTLPPQQLIPNQFELVLSTGIRSVLLRFRTDNLYLLGYMMENGQWLEFRGDHSDIHFITEPGTQFLDFRGSYIELQRTANVSINNVTIGFHTLVNAIYQLATREESQTRARSLIVVIFMFSEAIRLNDVQNFVAQNYIGGATIGDDSSLMQQIHAWGQLSKVLLFPDFFPHGLSEEWSIPRIRQMLGMALYSEGEPPAGAKHKRRSVGLPLLDVFSVRITDKRGDTREIYGTITITDALRTQLIYSHSRGNPEYADPYLQLSLTGPSEPVSALGDVTIKFLLYDRARNDEVILDEEFNWHFYDSGNIYDTVLSKVFNIDGGSLFINYAVFSNAVTANMRIQKFRGGEYVSEIYGMVLSSISWVGDDAINWLFNRERPDYVRVRSGDLIPLLRSVAAVPLNFPFDVTAIIYDVNSNSDRVLANCTVSFNPKVFGSDIANIQEEDYETSVIVDWVRAF